MRQFNNILYVSHGSADENAGLEQALWLARNNRASLSVLVACPEFPKDVPDFKQTYEDSLLEHVRALIEKTKRSLKIRGNLQISVALATDNKPSVRIVQQVLREGHDLIVKEAEVRKRRGGFKALDMALLRRCPCPVWLCRPVRRSRDDIRVAVAIDPESDEAASRALSVRMLQLSRSLADSGHPTLQIVSCWEYPYEDFLRHNAWAKADEGRIAAAVTEARESSRRSLDRLITDAKLVGTHEIQHLRGRADDVIPSFVKAHRIDVLVMGTVARTGIAGFTVGNTAENIFQELTCSLIALKPPGFVSPVAIR